MFTLISGILVYFLSEISIIWFIFFIKGVRDNVSEISQQPSYDIKLHSLSQMKKYTFILGTYLLCFVSLLSRLNRMILYP